MEERQLKINCPYCTKEITPDTTQCPSCGTTYGSDTRRFIKELAKKVSSEHIPERRKFDRVPRKFRIVFPTAKTLKKHYLSNISTGGVFIKTKEPLNRGARFKLKIFLPDGDKELEVLSEVIWSHREEWIMKDKKFPPGMGVKFLNLSPEGKERIDKILHQPEK